MLPSRVFACDINNTRKHRPVLSKARSEGLRAVVSDSSVEVDLPVFSPDGPEAVAAFICDICLCHADVGVGS